MATPAIFLAASALILAVLFRPRFFVRRRNLAVLGEELAAASRLGIPLQRVLRAYEKRDPKVAPSELGDTEPPPDEPKSTP